MQSWYLVQSKPRQELLARQNLDNQGFRTYLPMISVRKKIRGRLINKAEAMFGRYLFIRLDDETDNWGPIRSTPGVARLVAFGAAPARIPDSLIEALQQREDEHGIQHVMETPPVPGDRIQILDGPFEGQEAIFYSASSKNRVQLLLKLAEKYVNLTIDNALIRKI